MRGHNVTERYDNVEVQVCLCAYTIIYVNISCQVEKMRNMDD